MAFNSALADEPSVTKSKVTVVNKESKSTDDLIQVYNKLSPSFRKALDSSVRSTKKGVQSIHPLESESVVKIIRELARQKGVFRVGVLDMGSWIGKLPILLEKLNAAQSLFTIFEIQAPIPGGLIKTPEGMAEWASEHLNKPLTKEERDEFSEHMIANKFFDAAEDIRKDEDIDVDFIVGITASMVAYISSNTVYWNHFSAVHGKTILISAADLRRFSEQAERPFEAAIGALLVSSLLIAVNDKLDYHDDSGCLFDYNGSRVSLVNTIKNLHIEGKCLDKMTSEQREAAISMLSSLKRMRIKRK